MRGRPQAEAGNALSDLVYRNLWVIVIEWFFMKLLMAWFEPKSSDVGNDHFANFSSTDSFVA